MSENLLMGIDVGTSACKVAVFREDGSVLAQTAKPCPVAYPHPGWAEQDPRDWWKAVTQGIREVLSDGVNPADIRAIGVDGQSWAAVPVDEKGEVLSSTPIWLDTRSREICERIKNKVGEERIFSLSGNDFLPGYSTPKMLWLQENNPQIFRRTDRFLQSNSYIVFMLTGVMSQDVSQGYGIHFFDMEHLSWNGDLAEELGLSLDLMPEIYPCDALVGEVTKEASELTGLCAGTPVAAGGLDAACGTLGAGVYQVGETQEQGGQAGGMSICLDRPLAHKKLILSPHVVPGKWLLQGGTTGGGGTLRWFKEQLGFGLSFDDLTREAENIPPGSEGVVFLPYMAGERSPIWDPDARGVFYGLSFDKTRGHLIRAILEGTAFSLEHNLRTAREAGAEVQVLNAMGGASNSRLWTQIKADVTGKTIRVSPSDTATTLGAAMLAGVGCGLYRDYEEAVKKTVTVTRVHEPDRKNHQIYEKCMELYLELYEDLKGTFKKFAP